jgi:hypothetical protein
MPLLVSASTSKVLCDGAPIEGIREFQYKIARNRANVHTVGSHERLSGYFGALYVECMIKVRSSFAELDKKMYESIDGIKPFQIVVQLGTQGKGDPVKQISFDDCILEDKSLGMDATGVAETVYRISATRAKEE